MKLSGLLEASHAYGGPWKLLLMNLRGGQSIGAILAFSIFAWIMSIHTTHHLSTPPTIKAVEGIAVYLTIYILASMPVTWFYFERAWFEWGSMIGDVLGIAGSVAVAVLTRGSTGASCTGLFTGADVAVVGMANVLEACKVEKVVFATGIANSLMFLATLLVQAFVKSRRHQVGI